MKYVTIPFDLYDKLHEFVTWQSDAPITFNGGTMDAISGYEVRLLEGSPAEGVHGILFDDLTYRCLAGIDSEGDDVGIVRGANHSVLTEVAAKAAQYVHTHPDPGQGLAILLEVLIQSGDLTDERAATASYEVESREHDVVDIFHSGGCTRVRLDGTIEQFPN